MSLTGRDLHVNIPLSNIALDYRPTGFIGDMIFPIVPVTKQSDGIVEWSLADAYRIEQTRRSPGTEANRIQRNASSSTYFCREYALMMPLTIEDRANADAAYLTKIREGRTAYIQDKLYLDWENRIASQLTSGTNVGSYSSPTSAWSSLATGTSNPVKDVETAMFNIADATGYSPNRIVMGVDAWRNFRRHADVQSLLYGSLGAGNVRYATVEQVKAIFEVEQVLIGRAYASTAGENQSAALTKLWGDAVLVYYAPMAPSVEAPSLGYSFRWSTPGIPNMQVMVHPYDTKTRSEDVEVAYHQDEKVIAKPLGFLLTTVNSL